MTEIPPMSARMLLCAAWKTLFAGLLLGPALFAQGSAAQIRVIAVEGDAATDSQGIPVPGITFQANPQMNYRDVFGQPMIDEEGGVYFGARLADNLVQINPSVAGLGFYYSDPSGTTRKLARVGDAIQGYPNNVFGAGSGIPLAYDNFRLVGGGEAFFFSLTQGPPLAGSPTSPGALFTARPGSLAVLVPMGAVAPGTGGALFDFVPTSIVEFSYSRNRSGEMAFGARLKLGSGSPPVTANSTTSNVSGIWAGSPDALELVARSQSSVPGLPGVFASENPFLIFEALAINESGRVLYELELSRTLGSPPATDQNDQALLVHDSGNGSVVVARGGDPAPGYPGGIFVNAFRVSERSLLPSGEVLFTAGIRTAPGPLVSDTAIYRWKDSSYTVQARRGDPAPGIANGTFFAFDEVLPAGGNYMLIRGRAMQPQPLGPDVAIAALWFGSPGNFQLIARQGGAAGPGTVLDPLLNTTVQELSTNVGFWLTNASYGLGGTAPSAMICNDSGQVVFSCRDSTATCSLYFMVCRRGHSALDLPGANRPVAQRVDAHRRRVLSASGSGTRSEQHGRSAGVQSSWRACNSAAFHRWVECRRDPHSSSRL